jgi:hypothetical protein
MLRELYAAPAAPVRKQGTQRRLPVVSLSDQNLNAHGPSQPDATAPMSERMQEQIKAVFQILDTDDSGTVDEEELAEAMFALGLTREGSGRSDIAKLLETVTADSGRSREIDLAKFSAIMQVFIMITASLLHLYSQKLHLNILFQYLPSAVSIHSSLAHSVQLSIRHLSLPPTTTQLSVHIASTAPLPISFWSKHFALLNMDYM